MQDSLSTTAVPPFPMQKDALQCGIPLPLSAKLAAHTVEEAKRYSANNTYELSDTTASALKLVSIARAHSPFCMMLAPVIAILRGRLMVTMGKLPLPK